MARLPLSSKRVVTVDDTTTADVAYRLACEGSTLHWQGDFQNARQLLSALGRRIDRHPPKVGATPSATFHLYRQFQSKRARILGMINISLEPDYTIHLRRAPDVRAACLEAYGPTVEKSWVSLRELLGIIGAHEWRKKGVFIKALDSRIHPHFGVFAPIRHEYVDLVNEAPLPTQTLAFDIGTGTGVLAAILAKRGVAKIIATDNDTRAVNCARENITRLGFDKQVEVVPAELFPAGRAPLIVCNPPWIPARPSSSIENAVYDFESRMLLGFLNGLSSHLEPAGEAWLILSDLAEHLGLRTREQLLAMIENAGLKILEKIDTLPTHPRASDPSDPLRSARAAEVTSLWRLAIK